MYCEPEPTEPPTQECAGNGRRALDHQCNTCERVWSKDTSKRRGITDRMCERRIRIAGSREMLAREDDMESTTHRGSTEVYQDILEKHDCCIKHAYNRSKKDYFHGSCCSFDLTLAGWMKCIALILHHHVVLVLIIFWVALIVADIDNAIFRCCRGPFTLHAFSHG